ncbi:lipocalin family protein [gamma proteobacterium HdN1]|nr:lipocalin family protein [gamma proteobacterium HdN1]
MVRCAFLGRWQGRFTSSEKTAVLTSLIRQSLALLLAALISGCSSLYFYPLKPWLQNPANLGVDYQDVVLIHRDGTRITGWWLPASTPLQGTVYFLHGNAENISTHVVSVAWLPAQGYQVFLIDYRGYGLSDGEADLDGSMADIQGGLNWLHASGRLQSSPLIVFGQSLGASMAIWVLAQPQNRGKAACLIEEAGFADYREVVNAAMKRSWLLWPLRPVVVPLMDNRYAPATVVGQLAPMPLLIAHSREDLVIPFRQAEKLYQAARPPKEMLVLRGAHARGPEQPEVQEALLQFMRSQCR